MSLTKLPKSLLHNSGMSQCWIDCMASRTHNLVIVGNGFDLHHGIKTSYSHYKDWLTIVHPDLFEQLNRYIDTSGDWWNDFEGNLARFDIMKIIKEVPRVYPPRDPRFPPSFYSPAESFFKRLREQITASFQEWVQTISLDKARKMMDLSAAGLYISFNYTDTLERVYCIPEEQILYIHGKALRGDKLFFGHSKSHYEIERDYMQKHGLREVESFFDNGPVITDEEYQLALNVSFFDKFPYTQIVAYSRLLMPAVRAAGTVISYGLSFSESDFQYLEWIVEQNPNLMWKVSWHTEEDKNKIDSFFKQVGIKTYSTFFF